MLGGEHLHDLPLGGVRSDSVARVEVRVAGAEKVPLIAVTAALSPSKWAHLNGGQR